MVANSLLLRTVHVIVSIRLRAYPATADHGNPLPGPENLTILAKNVIEPPPRECERGPAKVGPWRRVKFLLRKFYRVRYCAGYVCPVFDKDIARVHRCVCTDINFRSSIINAKSIIRFKLFFFFLYLRSRR